ncbi:hypothetical protein [Caloramator proteoclasticus]|uniref:DUF2953 domain-containing protein n=1 Tax=Caloramator proteoclasticus DSM 10124 TaxID=1121262 RepID=A0A1M4TAV6_9CLOT|nr:hypothetical protein [Caloramator proteoclasticus]SHE41583.1 hypothetical protein SAMN02746091_00333 [Caloramator proteoclasticus DSM 10124]
MKYVILLIFILLLFMPINISIIYDEKSFFIKIYNFKVINLFKKKKTNKVKEKPKIKFNYRFASHYIRPTINNINYLLKRINLRLNYNLKVSSSDAFYAAMIFGVLNSVLPVLFAYLSNNYKFYHSGSIYCDFNSTKPKLEFKLSISFNLMIIIIFLIKSFIILIKIYKGGVLYGRASNRRIDENYNG